MRVRYDRELRVGADVKTQWQGRTRYGVILGQDAYNTRVQWYLNPRYIFNPCDASDTHPHALNEKGRNMIIACTPERERLVERLRVAIAPFHESATTHWDQWITNWQREVDRLGLTVTERANNLSLWLTPEQQEAVSIKIWMTGRVLVGNPPATRVQHY